MNAGRALQVATTVLHGALEGSVLFAGTAGTLQQDNANFFWNDASNRLGIGTNAPSARLHIAGAVSASESSFLINTTHTGPFVSVVNINPQKTGFDTNYFSALAFEPQLNTDSSVEVGDMWGITGNPRLLGSSNLTRAVGFRANVQHTSSGMLRNAYQFLANGITKTTGQLLNAYGLYVADFGSVGSVSNWAVYTVGANPSFFGGAVTTASLSTGPAVTTTLSATAITANSLTVASGGAFRTGVGAGNTALLQAYDVDGAAYTTFLTLTANNAPTCTLSNVTSSTAFNPTTNDGAALGTASTAMWSDLFLASGAVVNWNNGDVLITHSTDTLTLTGGVLSVTSSGVTNGISIATSHTASFSSGLSCNPIRTGTNTGWFAALVFEARLQTDTSVTVTDLWGMSGNSRVDSASNVTRAAGVRGTVQHTSSGTTATAVGFRMDGITKSAGAITNAYGLYITDLAGVGSNGNWAIYSLGTLAPNYFQGMVAIGNNATPIATLDVRPNTLASGNPRAVYMDFAAHTNMTASTEMVDFQVDGNRTAQFATGNITTQREVYLRARTYGAVGASTITTAATLAIDSAPKAGANMTLTDTFALWVQAGATRMDGRMLNKQGADIASANDLTLGEDGNSWEITGVTQINAITTARWQNGSKISLLFTSTPTVKHNTAGGAGTAPILLQGAVDFAATAGDTLMLLLSEIGGVQAWRQLSVAAI